MTCPAIITGDRFLGRVLEHIDCQAQSLGTFGYQALADPNSIAVGVFAGLLTLFIALFGIRLLLGYSFQGGDIVAAILKVGIVLTLAFSWPAFKTVIYDVTLKGPAEITSTITLQDVASAKGLVGRLQDADAAMLRLTEQGAGRNTGAYIDREVAGGTFASVALQDENSFGLARLFYLSGIIGSLALLRVLGGLLLALAPLMAGLLLIDATRGLFAGWLKGLILVILGSVGSSIVLSIEMAVLEPWLNDALRVRRLGYAIPSAPTELLALTLAFTIVQFSMIWALAKISFYRGWLSIPDITAIRSNAESPVHNSAQHSLRQGMVLRERALQTASGVERIVHSESDHQIFRTETRALGSPSHSHHSRDTRLPVARPRLGDGAKRVSRQTLAAKRRDDL